MRHLDSRLVLAVLILSADLGAASAEDLVDMRQLGARGAVLETAPSTEGGIREPQGVGDFNGDGLDDLGVIYRSEPSETGQTWRSAVVYGRRGLQGRHALDELPETVVFRVNNPFFRGTGRPNHLHGVGDLNVDGFDDFMVGFSGYRFTAEQRDSGAAFLVYGAPGLVGRGLIEEVGETIPGVRFWSSDPTHRSVGFNFRNVGDFNGDGRDDLAISAPSSDVEKCETDVEICDRAGVLFVLFETRELPPLVDLAEVGRNIPGFVIRGTTLLETPEGPIVRAAAALGSGIEAAGDFNGDGFDDFLLSAKDLFTLYLVRGSPEPPAVIDLGGLDAAGLRRLGITAFRTPFDNRIFADSHQSTGIGDIDGDGRSEVVVGVSRQDPKFGRDLKDSELYLFRGREEFPAVVEMGDVPPDLQATVFRPLQWGDYLGISVASAGDLNGDSVPDFLVGAKRSWRDGLADVGEAYAVFSRPDCPPEVRLQDGFEGIRMFGEGIWQGFGLVSSAGDFNGDGALDMAVGAPYNPPPNLGVAPDSSRIYLIYGSGTDRPPLTLLGLTPDFGTERGGTPVAVRGSGFAAGVSVRFGDRAALGVELVSSSELRVVTPPGAALGAVDVSVTAAGETRRVLGGFEYIQPLPEIDLADPGRRGFTMLGDGERRLGESMTLGDITGDGAAEVVMTLTPNVFADSWCVAVLHGGPRRSGLVELSRPSTGLTLIDLEVTGNGGLVAMVGDVDGDGVGDLGLGATGGRGLILFGRPELPLTLDAASELASGGAVELAVPGVFGRFHFAPAGDVDGDGVGDVAVGHPTSGLVGEGLGRIEGPGEVILVAGRRSWPPRTDLSGGAAAGVIARLRGEPREALGLGLTRAGDVNGDGRPDLLVSTVTPRRAYLIFGPEAPPGERAISEYVEAGGGVAFDVDGGPEGEFDTPWVAGPGDVDGDGLDDVLLGFVDHHVFAGAIFLVPGSRELPRFLELPGYPGAVEFIGPGSDTQVGQVGPAGDFNGDGLADFLTRSRARLGDPPGNLLVIFGAPDLPQSVELASLRGRGLEIEGTVPIGSPEVVVHETGDVDGDGVSDIAFSERGINDPVGRAHVVFGLAPEADFVRGDANFDDAVNITDAVFTLGFLFQGGVSPACVDAVDTNDSGTLEITDVIHLLNHLFQGTAPPPPPYPAPGRDPTADALGCRGF